MKAIIRTKKFKAVASLKSRESHTFRTRPTENADPKKAHKNELLYGRIDYSAYLAEKLAAYKEKNHVRKDAVLAIEYLLTASPEFFENLNIAEREADLVKWKEEQVEFLKAKHGVENLLCVYMHLDEKTPHIEAYVLPIDPKGKLNCKHFLGGAKKLSDLQTAYAAHNKKFGLERGILGSTASHQRVKQFYAMVDQPSQISNSALKEAVKLDKPTLSDTLSPAEYIEKQQRKIFENVAEMFKGVVQQSKLVPQAKNILKKAERADRIMARQKFKHTKELEEYKKQLTQQVKVVEAFELLSQENKELKTALAEAKLEIKRLKPSNEPTLKLRA